jgi:NitT/TauT family transport system substrate-binding protein
VEIQPITNGAAVAAAVAGGAIDIGRSSLLALITAHAHGLPFALVAPSGIYLVSSSTGAIIVPKDSSIRSGRDLNGKVVSAASLNDVSILGARTWIDKTGGSDASVQFVETTGPQAGVALDTGRVSAAILVNPILAQMMGTGKYRALTDPIAPLGSRVLEAAWFTTTDFAAKNPDVIRKFSSVLAAASAYCNQHPDQTVGLLASFAKFDPDVIAHMTRDKYDLKLTPTDIQPVVDAAAKFGMIPSRFDVTTFISEYALR